MEGPPKRPLTVAGAAGSLEHPALPGLRGQGASDGHTDHGGDLRCDECRDAGAGQQCRRTGRARCPGYPAVGPVLHCVRPLPHLAAVRAYPLGCGDQSGATATATGRQGPSQRSALHRATWGDWRLCSLVSGRRRRYSGRGHPGLDRAVLAAVGGCQHLFARYLTSKSICDAHYLCRVDADVHQQLEPNPG